MQKASDIISTLVSIFGSKDVFIKELQIAFGQRLLAISDGNYDDEVSSWSSTLLAMAANQSLWCEESFTTWRFSKCGSERPLCKYVMS